MGITLEIPEFEDAEREFGVMKDDYAVGSTTGGSRAIGKSRHVPTGMVKQHTRKTKSGKTVIVKAHKLKRGPGMTQTAKHIQKHGLKWGGKTFTNAHQLGSWLRARGSSLTHFKAKHGAVVHAIPHFHVALAHEHKTKRAKTTSSTARKVSSTFKAKRRKKGSTPASAVRSGASKVALKFGDSE
jgi:hypothetical protein